MSKKTICLQTVLGTALVLALALSASASVTYVSYNMDTPGGALGLSQTYGTGIYQITAYGWKTNDAPVITGTLGGASGSWNVNTVYQSHLYGKQGEGPVEDGLGMSADPDGDNEDWDQPGSAYQWGFVQLDVRNIEQISNLLYFQVQIGSAQTHEWFTIWGSNDATPGSATLLMEGSAGTSAQTPFFDIPGWSNYSYIWFGSILEPGSNDDHSDTLINSDLAFTQYPVPEPGTLGMVGSGVLSVAFGLRKRLADR
jgi:PEP-CTERM motif